MNQRGIIILAAATLLLGTVTFFGVRQSDQQVAVQTQPVAAFPDLKNQGPRIAKVVITGAKSKVTLVHGDQDTWQVAELAGYAAKPDLVSRLFLDLAGLTLLDKRSGRKENLEVMGLAAPGEGGSGLEIAVLDAQGTVLADIIQGKVKDVAANNTSGTLYVRRPAEDQAWFARSNLQAAREPADWADKSIVELPRPRIKSIEGRIGANDAINLTFAGPDSTEFTLANLPKGRSGDRIAVSNFGSTLSALTFEGVKRAHDVDMSGAQLVRFHLYNGIVLDLLIKRVDGQSLITLTASLDEAQMIRWIERESPHSAVVGKGEGADKEKEKAAYKEGVIKAARSELDAISARTSPWVYVISNAKAADLTLGFEALLEKVEAGKDKAKQ